jgi:hypothetical protein
MGSNLTRFYYESEEEMERYLPKASFEDVETIEADAIEKRLQEKNISYIRVDL